MKQSCSCLPRALLSTLYSWTLLVTFLFGAQLNQVYKLEALCGMPHTVSYDDILSQKKNVVLAPHKQASDRFAENSDADRMVHSLLGNHVYRFMRSSRAMHKR